MRTCFNVGDLTLTPSPSQYTYISLSFFQIFTLSYSQDPATRCRISPPSLNKHTQTHVPLHTHANTRTHTHERTHARMHTVTHIHTRAPTHARTHTYPIIQWAAVRTHLPAINVPPQKCQKRRRPKSKYCKDTCQGHSPGFEPQPPTIFLAVLMPQSPVGGEKKTQICRPLQ